MSTLLNAGAMPWQEALLTLHPARRDWMERGGSLTARLCSLGTVTVKIQQECSESASAEDAVCLSIASGEAVWRRDICLLVDVEPMVVAYSVTPLSESITNWKAMRQLGTRPLADILYGDRAVSRSRFSYRLVTPDDLLYRQASSACPELATQELWARRSLFVRNSAPLLVVECFLPGLWRKALSASGTERWTAQLPNPGKEMAASSRKITTTSRKGTQMKTPSEAVSDMIFMGKWGSQTLCAAAELGVFDHLGIESPRTAADVAKEVELDPDLLYRLLRALASLGLLNETDKRQFTLTERGAVLRTDAPDSLRSMAMLEGGPEHWAIWKHVPTIVREGKQNAFMREYGQMAFDWARAHPDGYGAVFGRAMSGFSAIQSSWALAALRDYDFSQIKGWCDVAGGHGHMMCAFLKKYPHLNGVVFDLPEVVGETEQLWAPRLGLEARCRYVAGDMFRDVTADADVYSMKMILHDWDDNECVRILRNIRRRAKNGGRLFIVEHIVPGPSEPHFAKLFDIHMMCWGTGKERTKNEYASLLEMSGWRHIATHFPEQGSMGVVEGATA